MSSSILLVGLARVNIFQLMSTDERSPILTCLMEPGQGSENWKGGGGTRMLPGDLAARELRSVWASLITSSSSLVLFLRDRLDDWNSSFAFSTPVSCNNIPSFHHETEILFIKCLTFVAGTASV